MVSNTRKFIGVLLITVTMVTGSLIYSANQEEASDGNDKPPSFNIEISRSRLIGQLDGDSCSIPGYKFTTDDAAAFDAPAGVPEVQKYKLESGVHLYHADTEMTVAQIKSMIVPEPDNKIMILHYNPINNAAKKFSLYPPLNSDKVVSINDPSAYSIPANQGIIIVSCEETDIWKVKSETQRGVGAPGGLAEITDNWVLIAGSDRLELNDYNITAVYPQNGPGFDFPENVVGDTLSLGQLSMIWLRISPEEADAGGGEPTDPAIDGYVNLPLANPAIIAAQNLTTLDVVKTTEGAHDRIKIFKDGNHPAHWGIIGYDGHENDYVNNPQPIMPASVIALNTAASYACPNPDFVIEGRPACPAAPADPVAGATLTCAATTEFVGDATAETATFTASSNTSLRGWTWDWNFGENNHSQTAGVVSHQYRVAGRFNASVTVTSADGSQLRAECPVDIESREVAAAVDRFSALPLVSPVILSDADLRLTNVDVVKKTDGAHDRIKIFKDGSYPAHWGIIGYDGHENDFINNPLRIAPALVAILDNPASYSGDAPALIVEGRIVAQPIEEAPAARVDITCSVTTAYANANDTIQDATFTLDLHGLDANGLTYIWGFAEEGNNFNGSNPEIHAYRTAGNHTAAVIVKRGEIVIAALACPPINIQSQPAAALAPAPAAQGGAAAQASKAAAQEAAMQTLATKAAEAKAAAEATAIIEEYIDRKTLGGGNPVPNPKDQEYSEYVNLMDSIGAKGFAIDFGRDGEIQLLDKDGDLAAQWQWEAGAAQWEGGLEETWQGAGDAAGGYDVQGRF